MVFGFHMLDLVVFYLVVLLLLVKNRMVLVVWQSMSRERCFTNGFAMSLQAVKNRVALGFFIFRLFIIYCNTNYIEFAHFILSNLLNIAVLACC